MISEELQGTKYFDHHMDHHHGQDDFVLWAHHPSRVPNAGTESYEHAKAVGAAEYSEYKGKPHLNMIRTHPEFTRKGVAAGLIHQLHKKYGYHNIKWGMTSPEGSALKDAMDAKYAKEKRHHVTTEENMNPLLKNILIEAALFCEAKRKCCRTCGGSKRVQCPGCARTGFVSRACIHCGGQGGADCPDCKVKGKVREDEFRSTRDAAPGSIVDDEIPGNDKAEKCPDCGKEHAPSLPCSKKKLLFGGELGEGKTGKKFDKLAHIRSIARNTVGQVKAGSVIIPKKSKKPKYKQDWMDEAQLPGGPFGAT